MNRTTTHIAAGLLALLASCSPTKSLTDGETLYTGIKEVAWGQKAKAVLKTRGDTVSHGMITDVANAVKGVADVLEGRTPNAASKGDAQQDNRGDKQLTREQSDSIRNEEQMLAAAMATARTEVEAVLAYPPTGSLFGSSSLHLPSSPGVMFYNLFADSKGKVGKWLYNSFAKAPVTMTDANPRTRALVAKNTLRNYGFFDGEVEYDILPDKKPGRAHVAYSVYPRQLYRFDSIEYRGFPQMMDSLLHSTQARSKLRRGDAFSVPNLDAERNRICSLMRNRGYYNFTTDAISYQADTLQRPGYVQLRVQPAAWMGDNMLRRYFIGRTEITLLKADDYMVVDSLPSGNRRQRTTTATLGSKTRNKRSGRLHLKMRYSGTPGRPPLRLGAMRKHLFYREGMPYHHDLMAKVGEQFSGMGVFSQVQMSFVPQNDDPECDTLTVRLLAILDKPYDSEFEARVTSKSNGQMGPGVSYSLSKRNALRRAETVTWKVHGSYEWQTGSRPDDVSASAINSYELGTSLQMDFPRLVLPGTRRLNSNALTGTMFKMDVSWLNRAGYFGMVELSGEATYTLQRTRLSKHSVTPLKLKYSSLLSTTAQFDEVASRNQALFVSMRDQLVPSMEYTYALTSSRRAANPGALTVTVKEAGNIVSGIYAACGHSFNEQDKTLLRVPFAQFVKLTVDMRKEMKLTPRQSIVGHLGMGVVWSYGNSSIAPYSDLFAIGGANSLRAFCLRGIGPGRYSPAKTNYSYLDQMGDMKLEANLEYRFPLLPSLFGAVFVDCGNVWLMKPDSQRPGGAISASHFARDLALGTGAGLRYDLDFLVIRFDVGVGIHAPYDTGRSGYYNMPRFARSLGYHFAIGYPF